MDQAGSTMVRYDFLVMGGALIMAIVFFWFASRFFKESQEIATKNKEEVIPFGRSITAGLIAGVIVVVIERIVSQWVSNPPKPDFSSVSNFLFSVIGILIVAFLVGSFLLFLVFYLILKGLRGITEKEGEDPSKFSKLTIVKSHVQNWISTLKKKRKFLKKYSTRIILPLALFTLTTIIAQCHFSSSIQKSIELSDRTLNDTLWLTTPVTLEIQQSVDLEGGRIFINVTNTHPTKKTGAMYLYKLEDSATKPEIVKEGGLGPGKKTNYSLTITSEMKNITFSCNPSKYGGFGFTFPSGKLYYVIKENSISYKISCDYCPPDGFIRRVPDYNTIETTFTVTNKCVKAVTITLYDWLDYSLSDIAI